MIARTSVCSILGQLGTQVSGEMMEPSGLQRIWGNDRTVRAPTVHCPWVMGHDAVAEPALPRPVPVPSTASACGYTPWLGLARVGRPNVPRARRQKRGKPRGRGGVKYTLHSDVHTGWGLMMPTCPDMPAPAGLRWRRRPSLPAGMPPGRAHAAWLGPRCPRRGGTGGASLRRPAPAPVDGRRRRRMPHAMPACRPLLGPRWRRGPLGPACVAPGRTWGARRVHPRPTRGALVGGCGVVPRRAGGPAPPAAPAR